MTDPSTAERPRLLLVDDTPANIDVLVLHLKKDFDLRVANRGARALQICRSGEHIDLILLDIMMPEMDGYDVCRQLRSDPATSSIPIIFLTARTEVEDVVNGFSAGGNDYVIKPFRVPELLARVQTQLTLQAQRSEIAKKNAETKELLHIVCHDVCNQFFAASLAMDLINECPGEDFRKLLPRVALSLKNGIGLTQLVRELCRVEDKQLQLQPVILRQALNEAVQLVEDRLRSKNITVTVDAPDLVVSAEPLSLINSVLGNLLTNAIKFSHPGGAIAVTATTGPGSACITVQDHGIGMPPHVLETLFDVAKSISRTGTAGERGTGFGMPLMQKFIRQFGGSVEVETRDVANFPKEHGTVFRIFLKLAKI